MTSIKRKRVTLSIDTKLEILSKLDKGVGLGQLAKEYNVGRSTVFDIRKRENKIRQFARETVYSGSLKRRCIIRRPDDANFDKAMHLWYCQQRANGTPISSMTFMKKAKIMYVEMYPDRNDGQFKASSGWLYRFKDRHGICHLNMSEETPPADPNVARATLKRSIEENRLTSDQVFNCGETGLYWRLLPGQTLADGSENRATVLKSSTHRVTLMATANASGDFRLPLVFIHKRAKPRCFADVTMSALPCHYYSQRGAWMSGDIFSDWFLKHFVPLVEEYLRRKTLPLRAILLVDNTPAHHAAENLVSETEDGYIQCIFLPANVISSIQPMDQGVLENLKRRYKRELLRRLWMRSESFESYSDFCNLLTVKDALHMCAKVWEEVSSVSLKRSWHILLPGDSQVEDENIEEVDDVSFTEERRQLAISAEEQEQWLVADKNEGGHRIFTDQEIIQQACETEADSDVEEEAERIPHAVAEVCLITGLKWLQQQPEASPQHLHMLRELHALAVRKREMNFSAPITSSAVHADRNVWKSSLPELSQRLIAQKEEELALDTKSAAPELAHIQDLLKVEGLDGTERALGTCLRPDQIGAVTVSEEHVKAEQDGRSADFDSVESEMNFSAPITSSTESTCPELSQRWIAQKEEELALDTKSATPELAHIQDLLKVEGLDGTELALGTCLRPDQIGAVTVSEEHVKAEQVGRSADFDSVESEMNFSAPITSSAVHADRNVWKSSLPELSQRLIAQKEEELALDTKSAAPELAHIQDLLKVEGLDGTKLAIGTCLRPDQIGAVTVSEEHVKAEQVGRSADFDSVESVSDKLKCEPTEISIGDHTSTDGCSWG